MGQALAGLRRRGYVPEVVFDVGASDGRWTQLAMTYWPGATYFCFEPLQERARELAALSGSNQGRVVVYCCGLGDRDQELEICVKPHLDESSFAFSGDDIRTVPVRRLDSMLAQHGIPRPQFLKVDVQGFEKRVLDGASSSLGAADLILLECTFIPFCPEMRTLDAIVGDMSQRGFIPYEIVDVLRRPLDGAMGQCDMLFIRKGHDLISDRRWAAG